MLNPSDLVLAAGLLLAPVGTVDPVPSKERWADVSAALVTTAIRLELIDPGEHRFDGSEFEDGDSSLFGSRARFAADLDYIRQRRLDLSGCPMVADGAWLPDARSAEVLADWWRVRRDKFRQLAAWHTDYADRFEPKILQAQRRLLLWEAIQRARSDSMFVVTRREYLGVVKKLIGDEMWDQRQLPEPNDE